MKKHGVKTLPGMHLLGVNVPLPINVLTYTHCEYQAIDICHLCCYYVCKEYAKHTFEVTKCFVCQHRLMNKETSDNIIKDYKVTYQYKNCMQITRMFGML